MGTRIRDQSLPLAVLPVALSATNKTNSRNSRNTCMKSTLPGGPLLEIARPIWTKVIESEQRTIWMRSMIRKNLVVREIDNFANALNEH